MSDIEKALTVFEGMSSGDPALVTRYMHPERYVEHNPRAAAGVEGLKQYVEGIAPGQAALTVIRAYQDGCYVFTQTDGLVLGDDTFFDVFKFEGGLIVEHWGFSAESAPPNKSGHTQVDGPTEPNRGEDTGKNKSLVRDYYEAVHIGGRHDAIPQYFSGDHCVRHEPGVADGLGAFRRDLEVLTQNRTIDRIQLLLGQNDFVFIVAEGTHGGEPCVYVDLYRVENGKVMEHWGFPQEVSPPGLQNNNTATL